MNHNKMSRRHMNSIQDTGIQGSKRYRVRVGDYRVIYALEQAQGIIHLLAVGHRREIYREQG